MTALSNPDWRSWSIVAAIARPETDLAGVAVEFAGGLALSSLTIVPGKEGSIGVWTGVSARPSVEASLEVAIGEFS